jgi:hypothetical protein
MPGCLIWVFRFFHRDFQLKGRHWLFDLHRYPRLNKINSQNSLGVLCDYHWRSDFVLIRNLAVSLASFQSFPIRFVEEVPLDSVSPEHPSRTLELEVSRIRLGGHGRLNRITRVL